MNKKLIFYDTYGVEEYYIYDPEKNDLSGCLRGETRLEVIEKIENWVSPRLGIRFELTDSQFNLYYPSGEPFTTYLEVARQLEESKQQLQQERQRAQQAEQRAEKLAEKLRELDINPEDI